MNCQKNIIPLTLWSDLQLALLPCLVDVCCRRWLNPLFSFFASLNPFLIGNRPKIRLGVLITLQKLKYWYDEIVSKAKVGDFPTSKMFFFFTYKRLSKLFILRLFWNHTKGRKFKKNVKQCFDGNKSSAVLHHIEMELVKSRWNHFSLWQKVLWCNKQEIENYWR